MGPPILFWQTLDVDVPYRGLAFHGEWLKGSGVEQVASTLFQWSSGMGRARRGGRLDAFFFGDFKHTLKRHLNFPRGFLASIAMGHNARPLDDLRNVAIVPWLG